jgi:hypothetical protein
MRRPRRDFHLKEKAGAATSVALTRRPSPGESPSVFTPNPDRPYFEAWLRRTGRQFAISGRLTQTATVLAAENGGTVDEWRMRLKTVLEGREIPSLDLLTRIDALLAGPTRARGDDSSQGSFF